MDSVWLEKFRKQLDQHHAWPFVYTFKFIVPAGKENSLRILFRNHVATERTSKNGNYTSFTYQMMMPSSEAVIEIYLAASKIEGLMAL